MKKMKIRIFFNRKIRIKEYNSYLNIFSKLTDCDLDMDIKTLHLRQLELPIFLQTIYGY